VAGGARDGGSAPYLGRGGGGRADHPPRPGRPPPGPLDPEADIAADDHLDAAGVDGFYGSPLDDRLRRLGRDQLLLCGAWLETGVHSTMRSANDRGYECLLVLDACDAYDATLVAASRSQIEMSGGIFGAVGLQADVHAALASA